MFYDYTKRFLLLTLTGSLSAFMVILIFDPFSIISPGNNAKIPNNPLYHYNFINHHDDIDCLFLGSSAVNYFDIESYCGEKNFSMGIESSNIFEHIEYGRYATKKHDLKEIVMFTTFYAFNPDRKNRPYFNQSSMRDPCLICDIVRQYFTYEAFKASFLISKRYLTSKIFESDFNLNGSRTRQKKTQNKSDFLKYLGWIYFDKEYYNSSTFKTPGSIDKGVKALKSFLLPLKLSGKKIKVVIPPVHRSLIKLIYYSGLGETFEYHRGMLVKEFGCIYDMNVYKEELSYYHLFFDTHHMADKDWAVTRLKTENCNTYAHNLKQTAEMIRPTTNEINEMRSVIDNFKEKHPSVLNKVFSFSRDDG